MLNFLRLRQQASDYLCKTKVKAAKKPLVSVQQKNSQREEGVRVYLANVEAEVVDAGLLIQAVAFGVDHHRQAFRGARWVAQAADLKTLHLNCIWFT